MRQRLQQLQQVLSLSRSQRGFAMRLKYHQNLAAVMRHILHVFIASYYISPSSCHIEYDNCCNLLIEEYFHFYFQSIVVTVWQNSDCGQDAIIARNVASIFAMSVLTEIRKDFARDALQVLYSLYIYRLAYQILSVIVITYTYPTLDLQFH